ncbi:class I SAM-dependent methyltransferase [Terrabacter lapilli]|uniref:Class I SAM-dependent methyltransferase n=1 Tax=Terrabacter lapilli TaxID=436231 RepID=A0ABN2RY60_9MICO
MTRDQFDRQTWERRWTEALREHGDAVAQRPPNAYALDVAAGLAPGRALDAGCGHGAEAIWLAAAGWTVAAVDFSATALGLARSTAESMGAEVAGRIDWVEGDLGSWAPEPGGFDLVTCLYVHVAGSVPEFVARMAGGVARGGTLLMVGHQPVDPETGEPTPAAGQVQVGVEDVVGVLDASTWRLVVAEERRRAQAGSGVDAVVQAVRVG